MSFQNDTVQCQIGPRGLGITLNRPQALNALDFGMIDSLTRLMGQDAQRFILRGGGGRAFCAGGDIKAVAQACRQLRTQGQSLDSVLDYFRAEYALNRFMGRIGDRCIALMDGVVMGGGYGLAAPCHVRIATERTLWAMPEVAIGFFPDVGSIHYMAGFPARQGAVLALTGGQVADPALLISLGIATHFVPYQRIDDLFEAFLSSAESPDTIVDDFSATVDPISIEYSPPDLCSNSFFDWMSLIENACEAGRVYAQTIRQKCPLSVCVTYAYMQWAQGRALPDVLDQDLTLAQFFLGQDDFYEGVRAQIIDKDKTPRWIHPRLEDVDTQLIQALFSGL